MRLICFVYEENYFKAGEKKGLHFTAFFRRRKKKEEMMRFYPYTKKPKSSLEESLEISTVETQVVVSSPVDYYVIDASEFVPISISPEPPATATPRFHNLFPTDTRMFAPMEQKSRSIYNNHHNNNGDAHIDAHINDSVWNPTLAEIIARDETMKNIIYLIYLMRDNRIIVDPSAHKLSEIYHFVMSSISLESLQLRQSLVSEMERDKNMVLLAFVLFTHADMERWGFEARYAKFCYVDRTQNLHSSLSYSDRLADFYSNLVQPSEFLKLASMLCLYEKRLSPFLI